ncbi:hypothetical protein N7491_011308 [Penicillium cf. griseofulvum]|uniref:Uncharacterized protein n=1 Tax=Penicillium cf. griseofulvum TaxID=2972120 RepID=A0A9W9JS53_9EURO|nr:hypothetical protein N7472_004689 [Penicillium cf. griseofulvum]KAJ5416406.1 hypothetical protein N7491_011308 [Penicillium cf. griseofulvum]KAJ5442257.1 hypothetical protein N7445_005264 [Penicillium cf. griseofulvum]
MSGSSDNRWRGGPSRQASQRNSNNRDKSGAQGSARDNNAAWGASNSPQEQHVPVRGFNAAESKNMLKPGPTETQFSTPYKPLSKDGPTQRSTAWGPKAQNMANGRDFFLELRKQIATLQRSGPPVGG